jgi:WD40 repeat protein
MLLVRLGYHDAHEREEEMTAQLPAATLRLRVGLLACAFALAGSCAGERDLPYVATPAPLRILSVNDGGALNAIGLPDIRLPDSVTVIDLTSDQPPATRTVSGTVPNTISGAPYAAIVHGGRYAFIPSHSWGAQETDANSPNQLAVVDLDAPGLDVAAVVPLPPNPWQALAHPDGERAIVITNHQFHVFRMEAGQPRLVAQSEPVPFSLVSFAIHPDASSIVATATPGELTTSSPVELHLFDLDGDTIRHASRISIEPGIGEIDQPFSPRFSPDGKRVLVLNGLGAPFSPPLDDVLSIDMTRSPPSVTEVVQNVAQGLESVAFHPSGRFAVVACIDGPYVGHLAVVDLTTSPMRLLSYLPIAFVPEGMEFSPHGSMLFVQATTAHHIAVYSVEGMRLVPSPFVLHTGEGPASMALTSR